MVETPKVVQKPLRDTEDSQRVVLFRRIEKGHWGWFKMGFRAI